MKWGAAAGAEASGRLAVRGLLRLLALLLLPAPGAASGWPVARRGQPTLGRWLSAGRGTYLAGEVPEEHPLRASTPVAPQPQGPLLLAVRTGRALVRGGRDASHSAQPCVATDCLPSVNPWLPDSPFAQVEDSLEPTAPLDDLSEGVRAQWYSPATAMRNKATFFKADEEVPGPFPDSSQAGADRAGPASVRDLATECVNAPSMWMDSRRNTCAMYIEYRWCSPQGLEGPGWLPDWGALNEYAVSGRNASVACCGCGGGVHALVAPSVALPLVSRRLVAPEDASQSEPGRWADAPGPPVLAATEDTVPAEHGLAAPKDRLPARYARYFNEESRQAARPLPMGLTARFYSAPPDECGEAEPVASAVERFLDYSPRQRGGSGRSLRWPSRHEPPLSGLFWARWTATLNVLLPGNYTFDLDIGFSTNSSLKVDGHTLITPGQCRASKTEKSCKKKSCFWDIEAEACLAPLPATEAEDEEGAATAEDEAAGSEPDVSLLAAPSAHSVLAGSRRSRASRALLGSWRHRRPSSNPRSQLQGSTHRAAHGLAARRSVRGSARRQSPLAEAEDGSEGFGPRPGQLELGRGGHCLDVTVMVRPSARTLTLLYQGPDTSGAKTVIPGQVLFCDPVVEACAMPELEACHAYQAECQDDAEDDAVEVPPPT